jgi:hypothetical protein
MIRTKLGLLGLCAVVLGMMAMSAGSAQASLFTWLVLHKNGTTLEIGGTEKVPVEGKKDSTHITLLTHLLGSPFSITCTNFELINVNLIAEGKLSEGGKVKFTGCEAYESGTLTNALGCHVHSAGQPNGTIETKEGKGALLLHETSPGVTELVTKLEPKTGTGFVTILTEECILPESNPVNGKLFIKDCELMAELHQEIHLIEEGPLTSLWVGTDNEEHLLTTLDGSGLVFLPSALSWGGKHNLP